MTSSFGKGKVVYGISAFKDAGNMSLTVSKTDIFGSRRHVSPIMSYGLDQVHENDEIELKVKDNPTMKSANTSIRKVWPLENIKMPPRDNIRVVRILSGPQSESQRRDFVN